MICVPNISLNPLRCSLKSAGKSRKLTITQIILHEIWQSRNNIKYNSITPSPKTTILKAHFKKYEIENTLNKAIAQLQGGQLPMLIPPP